MKIGLILVLSALILTAASGKADDKESQSSGFNCEAALQDLFRGTVRLELERSRSWASLPSDPPKERMYALSPMGDIALFYGASGIFSKSKYEGQLMAGNIDSGKRKLALSGDSVIQIDGEGRFRSFSPDGTSIVVAHDRLEQHKQQPKHLKILGDVPDLKLIEVATGETISELSLPAWQGAEKSSPVRMTHLPDGTILASEIATYRPKDKSEVHLMAYSPEGDRIVVISDHGEFFTYSPRSGEIIDRVLNPGFESMNATPLGLAIGGRTVFFHDSQRFDKITAFELGSEGKNKGKILAQLDAPKKERKPPKEFAVIDRATGRPTGEKRVVESPDEGSEELEILAASPTGHSVLLTMGARPSGNGNDHLLIWSPQSNRQVEINSGMHVRRAQFSADGKNCALVGYSEESGLVTVKTFDADGSLIKEFKIANSGTEPERLSKQFDIIPAGSQGWIIGLYDNSDSRIVPGKAPLKGTLREGIESSVRFPKAEGKAVIQLLSIPLQTDQRMLRLGTATMKGMVKSIQLAQNGGALIVERGTYGQDPGKFGNLVLLKLNQVPHD